MLLTGVQFLQCSEYWVMCVNACVIYLQVILLILYEYEYMRHSSDVFKCFHFLCVLIMSIVSVKVPYLCPMFNIVTCRVVHVTEITGSSSDDWICLAL
jgi:hypothetical protein